MQADMERESCLNFQSESERNFFDEDSRRAQALMRKLDLDSDGNGISQTNEEDSENTTEETLTKSERGVRIAIGRIRGCVSKINAVTKNNGVTRSIVSAALRDVSGGQEVTESVSSPSKGRITMRERNTSQASVQPRAVTEQIPNSNVDTIPTLPVGAQKMEIVSKDMPPLENLPSQASTLPSETLKEEKSPEMNLIDDVAGHLRDCVKSVTGALKGDDHNPERLLDVDRCNAAAAVAKQFYSVMRLKLDALKEIRG